MAKVLGRGLEAVRHAPDPDPVRREAMAFVENLVRMAPALHRFAATVLAEAEGGGLPPAVRLRLEGPARELLRLCEAADDVDAGVA